MLFAFRAVWLLWWLLLMLKDAWALAVHMAQEAGAAYTASLKEYFF